ncbi:MAG TPA: hypothetical protein VH518_13615 [Tepidisphaeraceae bacterium]
MTVSQITGPVLKPLAYFLEKDDMKLLGLGRTMRWANRFNRLSFGSNQKLRKKLYQQQFATLLRENGVAQHTPIEMNDGWAIDRSMTLPHLQQLLKDSAEIIDKRGQRPTDDFGKPFLLSIMKGEDIDRYSSILDFATSSQMVSTVAKECGFIPMLGNSMPPGVRLMESSTKFDPQPNGPWRSSQLWHLDYHSSPTIYVVVALVDITSDMGPLVFMSRSDSEKMASALNYRAKGSAYRVKDEAMNKVLGDAKLIEFTGPAGSVLFLDSNRCFHYGSRCPASPRYHMQYAYLSCCRTDFGDISRKQTAFRTKQGDAKLRRLVLERCFTC